MWGPIGYGFFCLFFVFFLFFFLVFLCCSPLSLLDFRSLFTLLFGNAGAPLTGFLLLSLAHLVKGGSKTGMMDFLVVELSWTGFVCHLRGVLPPCIQGQVSVRWRFTWFAAGLGAFSFNGFTGSVCQVMRFLLPSEGWFVLYLCRGCNGGRPRMYS